jgi:hypothetical protein
MTQRRRIPPLTPEQTQRARNHMQDLYGERALPKDPPAEQQPPKAPERRG